MSPKRAKSIQRRGRVLVRIGLVAGGWVLFLWMWRKVLSTTSAATVAHAAEILSVTLVAVTSLTAWWVIHNIRIFRRKGPRTRSTEVAMVFERDFVGRALIADWGLLKDAPEIEVAIKGDVKVYRSDVATSGLSESDVLAASTAR